MRKELLCSKGKGDYRQFGDHTVTVSNWFYRATCNFFPGENRACSNVQCVKWTWGIKGVTDLTTTSKCCFSVCKMVLHLGRWLAYYKGESQMWWVSYDGSLRQEKVVGVFYVSVLYSVLLVYLYTAVHSFVEVWISWKCMDKTLKSIWLIFL